MTRFTLIALFCLGLLAASCNKKEEPGVSKAVLTAGIWLGDRTETRTTTGAETETETEDISSSAIEFREDDTYVIYEKNPDTGELVQAETGNYTLNGRQIRIPALQESLDAETIALLQSLGVTIPESLTIRRITDTVLELEIRVSGSFLGQSFQITSVSFFNRNN